MTTTYIEARLSELGFHPTPSPIDIWYERGNVRVVLEDGQVDVYVFTDARRYTLEWEASFSSLTPADAITATIRTALA